MPEIPRDPRQLARDILSGKIKLEDLAKERQRQAGGNAPPRTLTTARLPQTPPPRPPQSPPVRANIPQQRPAQRQPVRQPQQRPQPQRPAVKAPPQQPREASPQFTVQTTGNVQRSIDAAATGGTQGYEQTAAARKTIADNKPASIRTFLSSKATLRQGILLAEILNKPLALRDQ